jgi:hypothetical protein
MSSDKQQLDGVTGFLGVGSLEILSIFFMLDGTSNFLFFIETYAKTSAWAILVTVPILVVAYVLGLFSSLATGAVLDLFLPSQLTPFLFCAVSESNNAALLQKYLEAERHTLLLHGCMTAFLLLGVGSWVEVRQMGTYGFVGYIGFVGGIGISALCPMLVRQIQKQTVAFAQAIVVSKQI